MKWKLLEEENAVLCVGEREKEKERGEGGGGGGERERQNTLNHYCCSVGTYMYLKAYNTQKQANSDKSVINIIYLFDTVTGFGSLVEEGGDNERMHNGNSVKQSTTSAGVGLSCILYHVGALKCVCVWGGGGRERERNTHVEIAKERPVIHTVIH